MVLYRDVGQEASLSVCVHCSARLVSSDKRACLARAPLSPEALSSSWELQPPGAVVNAERPGERSSKPQQGQQSHISRDGRGSITCTLRVLR